MSSYDVRQPSPLRSLERNVKYDNAKLREKIAQRRSILTQCDQKLRSLEAYQGIQVNQIPKNSPPRRHTIGETFKQRYSSPLIRNVDDSFDSISRKRERKEAAELRLKGLFSRSISKSEYDEDGFVPKSLSFATATTASTMSSDGKSSSSYPKVFDNDSLDEEDGFEIVSSIDKKIQVKHHISQQEHIQVYDNFIIINI